MKTEKRKTKPENCEPQSTLEEVIKIWFVIQEIRYYHAIKCKDFIMNTALKIGIEGLWILFKIEYKNLSDIDKKKFKEAIKIKKLNVI